MTPEQILANPPRVLTQAQRESYFEKGYVLVENVVPPEWLQRLREVTDEFVERSRSVTESDAVWDLEPDHTAENPRLRRLTSPVEQHPAYWEFASESLLADVAADVVGPDVKFHHSKLNFKWAEGGEEVKWHQDVQFWPHTNYSPATIGTLLYDCGPEQGPLGGLSGSHNGPLFDLYDEDGAWNGALSDTDAATLDLDRVDYMTGPAGSLTIHNCRTVHGSPPNQSDTGRPLLLYAYSAADAFPYTYNPIMSSYYGAIVRGKTARYAHHDSRPCQIPPDWSGGYRSIFASQQDEEDAPSTHNCRTVHGSPPNQSDTGRPLLLYAYSSADAFPYTYNPIMSSYYGAIVRGKTARYAHHDSRPCQIPPDWSGGYRSIFASQQDEEDAPATGM